MNNIDRQLIFIVVILVISGVLILASSSLVLSQKRFGSSFYYVFHQLIYGVLIGTILMIVFSKINYKTWRKFSLPFLVASLFLMTLVFLPSIGFSAGGARRWLVFGPIFFQPSEILKLAVIVYLATWLDTKREEVKTVSYGFFPFIVMISIVGVFLVMQPDIGTLGVIVATSAVLYFLGGGRISQLLSLGALGVLALFLLVQIAPYRLNRFLVFFNPAIDPKGISYQINQAFIAIGSGGFWGLGLGQGIQKYNYLPEPMGDSIFAITAEEFGFLGSAVLVGLFLFFIYRGFTIAKFAPDSFSKFLALGITSSIGIQAFINIAAISGLLPLTGIPLPFISYGSSALIINLASVGVLMNISRYS